jgi:hypothetical protein
LIFNLIQPFIINKYSELIEEVKKESKEADFYLIILALNSSKISKERETIKKKKLKINDEDNFSIIVNIVLKNIIQLLASHQDVDENKE